MRNVAGEGSALTMQFGLSAPAAVGDRLLAVLELGRLGVEG